MRIATWNVNSIRARLPRLLPWLEERAPDVVCLQETKCEDAQFPREPIEELGYNVECFGQKTYNGVAILSKRPIEDVVRGLPGDDEKRLIGAMVGDFLLLDVYVINGKEVGSPFYERKLDWLERLAGFLAEHYPPAILNSEKVLLMGDFNITFDDRDVPDPEAWREQILCSTPERAALARVMAPGLHDLVRHFDQEDDVYTWWDFRTRGFERGAGLRIDHFLASAPALAACRGVEVDREARAGDKPSDHAPVIATFAD